MTTTTLAAADTLRAIARIYEDCTDEDNQWDSNDIVEAVATLLIDVGVMNVCPYHEVYPAEMGEYGCPRCKTERDNDDEDDEGGEGGDDD